MRLCYALIPLLLSAQAFAYTEAQFKAVTTEKEAQLEQIRDQEIEQIRIVLGRRFDESRRPDILLRLAELYVEKYRHFFLKENEVYQALLKQGQKPSKVDHVRSHEQLNKSSAALQSILKSEVEFAKLDQVHFFMGYNEQELGRDDEAAAEFHMVVTRWPNSEFASEAWRALAERAFGLKRFEEAAKDYEQAAKFTKVESYPRTLYKLSWAYFRIRRQKDALETMKKAIAASTGNERFVSMRDEAMNDMVFFFSEAGRFSDAREYFGSISGGTEVYVTALQKLSRNYDRDGKYRNALDVNRGLFEEYGSKKPEVAYKILVHDVELYRKLADAKGEEAALHKMVDYFAAHASDIGKSDEEAAWTQAKSYLRGRVTEIHKDAVAHKDRTGFSRAADLYALYMKAFLSDPRNDKEAAERSQIRIYRTDALLASGRETDAIPELEAALSDSKGDQKLRKEAGTSLLNLLIKKIDALKKDAKAEGEYKDARKRFMDAAEVFEGAFPKDPLVAELRYKRARLAVEDSGPDGLSKSARNALKDLVASYPERPEALEAAHDLVADALKRKENDEANELAKSFLVNQRLIGADKKKELKSYLDSVVSRDSFEHVKALEDDKQNLNAAKEYEKLAASAKDREVSYKSLYNAAVNFEKGGDEDAAFRVHEELLSTYGAKAKSSEVDLKRIARDKLARSDYARAATLYLRMMANKDFDSNERLSFGIVAFRIHWGSADRVSAVTVSEKIKNGVCAEKGQPAVCQDLIFWTAQAMVESGRHQDAVKYLRAYATSKGSPRRAQAYIEAYEIAFKMKDATLAHTMLLSAASAAGKGASAEERSAVAHAAFLLIEPKFKEFQSIHLVLPEQKLKMATSQKLSSIDKLVKDYERVAAIGDAQWTMASMGRLGKAYRDFALEIVNAPVPDRIEKDPALAAKYKSQLGTFAGPLNARGIDYLRKGYEQGTKLGITSPAFVELSRDYSSAVPDKVAPAEFTYEPIPSALLGALKEQSKEDLLQPGNEWRRDVGVRISATPKQAAGWVELGNLEMLSGRAQLARIAYEQALVVEPKNSAAMNNLAYVLLQDGDTIETGLALARALKDSGGSRDVRLNLARHRLAFRQFSSALGVLEPAMKESQTAEDRSAKIAWAVGLTGAGRMDEAKSALEALDAKGASSFSLWYNWCVWALRKGSSDDRSDAVDMLKGRQNGLSSAEKNAVQRLLAGVKR